MRPSNRKRAIEWLDGKTAEDLAAIEVAGRLLFPDRLLKPQKGGGFEEIPVMIRVPRPQEVMEARGEAIRIFRKQGLDRKEDSELFEELDTLCNLARAIRSATPPHAQFITVEEMLSRDEKGYDIPSLFDLWERVQFYRKNIDPRLIEFSEEDVVTAALAIDRVQNLGPLVGIAGSEVDSFVISMASLLAKCLMHKPSSPSTETSTPANSPLTSSETS
jgi:hypothetical protein